MTPEPVLCECGAPLRPRWSPNPCYCTCGHPQRGMDPPRESDEAIRDRLRRTTRQLRDVPRCQTCGNMLSADGACALCDTPRQED